MEIKKVLEDVDRFHYEIKENFSILEIPNEIKDRQKQFYEIEKAENFFKKLTEHFETEEYLFSMIGSDIGLKDSIDILRKEHNIILDQIEYFTKIVYGNILPLNDETIKELNLILSDINYLVMSHLLTEEKFYSQIMPNKSIIEKSFEVTVEDPDLEESVEVLKILMQSEILLAKYYNLGSQKFVEDKDFFLNIARQEVRHFQNIKRMVNCIIRNKYNFVSNKTIKIKAAELFLKGVKDTVLRMEKEELGKIKFISIAYDFEKSIMENKYSSILQTNDLEYNSFIREIERDTQIHISLVEKKFKEYKDIGEKV